MTNRFDPFNALFDEFFTRNLAETPERARSQWTPPIDAFVTGESLVVEVALAGVDPKTVELTATGNRLTVKGARTRHAPADSKLLRNEVVYGTFERTLELPEGTDASRAEASFEFGMLVVKLPAAGAFVPKKIEIARAA